MIRYFLVALVLLIVSPLRGADLPVTLLPYWPTPAQWHGRPGWEERGPEFRRWLAPAVRVTRNGGGGSGTICYYDDTDNYAYVISCGHLFATGMKGVEEYKRSPDTRKVEVFYHNNVHLDKPEEYTAEVLCHVWQNGIHDVSLMRFKPKWADPWVSPIAPADFALEKGKFYHSTGCDGLTECAHYLVKYQEERGSGSVTEILTTENGPRGGRSGGGVMSDDHQLLFICSRGGGGYGYWTSLKQIHGFLAKQGFQDVLDGRSLANKIPVVDRNNDQRQYPRNYIPQPRKD